MMYEVVQRTQMPHDVVVDTLASYETHEMAVKFMHWYVRELHDTFAFAAGSSYRVSDSSIQVVGPEGLCREEFLVQENCA